MDNLSIWGNWREERNFIIFTGIYGIDLSENPLANQSSMTYDDYVDDNAHLIAQSLYLSVVSLLKLI